MSRDIRKLLAQAEEGYLIECIDDEGIVDLYAKNGYGDTLLHVAVGFSDIDLVEYLVDRGLDVNAQGEGEVTPLCSAAMGCDVAMIAKLLSLGADMNIPDCLGRKPPEVFFNSLSQQNKEKGPHKLPSPE